MAILSLAFAADSSLGTTIGIDLGTTYSCVGVMKAGRVEIIPNDQVSPPSTRFEKKKKEGRGQLAFPSFFMLLPTPSTRYSLVSQKESA